MMLNTRLDSCREPGLLSDQQPIEAVNSGRRLTGETIESAAVGPHPPPVHREMSVASLLSRFDRQLPFILRLGTTLELSDYREKRCKFPNQVTSRRTCLHTHTHTHTHTPRVGNLSRTSLAVCLGRRYTADLSTAQVITLIIAIIIRCGHAFAFLFCLVLFGFLLVGLVFFSRP